MSTRLHVSPRRGARCGLALVELVVVLLILVLIAGTAITATEGLVEDSRYETTRATLENVEEAILGPYAPPTAHDDTLLAGFVADVGRLPRLEGEDASELLQELWSKPASVEAFSLQLPPGDPELRLPGGWRGPYVHLALGRTRLFDGWGQPLAIFKDDGTTAIAGDHPGRIASLGANLVDGGTGYAEDVGITIARTIEPVVLPRHRASLVIRLEPAIEGGSTTDCLVRVYAPVDGDVRMIDQKWFAPSETLTTHAFPDLPIGPRIVRAYQWTRDTLPTATDPAPLSPRSAPVTVLLVSGGVPEIVLKVGAPVLPRER